MKIVWDDVKSMLDTVFYIALIIMSLYMAFKHFHDDTCFLYVTAVTYWSFRAKVSLDEDIAKENHNEATSR